MQARREIVQQADALIQQHAATAARVLLKVMVEVDPKGWTKLGVHLTCRGEQEGGIVCRGEYIAVPWQRIWRRHERPRLRRRQQHSREYMVQPGEVGP
jgi:hypothetical protein